MKTLRSIENRRNRIEEIDYLRGFAILSVVAIHTSANFTEIRDINLLLVMNVIVDVFSHFAVPSFIFVSGFVLSLSYNGQFSKKSFYTKRAKSIIPQYIIFSIFYILFKIGLSSINGKVNSPSISTVIFDLLTASSYYHLWFFAVIIQFYISYPYIIKIYNIFANKKRILCLISITLIVQQMWIVISDIAQTILDLTTYLNSINYYLNLFINSWLSLIFLSYIFYFILGIYVAQNYKDMNKQILKAKKWAILTILVMTGIISLLFIEGIIRYGGYYKIPHTYFMLLDLIESLYFPLIILIILNISLNISIMKNKYSNIILLLGKYSFGIYLVHALYMDIIIQIVYPYFGIYNNQLIFYPVLFILTIFLSYFSVSQISHLPNSRIIIGIKS